MIDIRIRYNGVKVRLRGEMGMKKLHNLRLLEIGLASVKERLVRGIGSDDAPTAPLKKRYAIYKSKVLGKRAIRDLRLTGDFLDTLLPRYADDTQAVAYPGGRAGRMKAILYHDLVSFSDGDQRKIAAQAQKYFKAQVAQVAYRLAPGGGKPGGSARPEFSRDPATFARAT